MSGFQRKETRDVVTISNDDDSSQLVIDEGNSIQDNAETPQDLPDRKRANGFNEYDSECSKSAVEVVRQSPEIPESDQQKQDIPIDLSGRNKRPIGFDEDPSASTEAADENPEMPEERDIPLDLSGQDRRMPREFANPPGHVHAPNIPRMEDRRVGIDQPSTSSSSCDSNLPGTSFGSNRTPIPPNLGAIRGSMFYQLLQQPLQQWYYNPQAKEAVPSACAQPPEHSSSSGSQSYMKIEEEDLECPFVGCRPSSTKGWFRNFSGVIKHMKNIHDDYTKCEMNGCYYYFDVETEKGKEARDSHLDDVHPDRTKCRHCEKWFVNKNSAYQHEWFAHKNTKTGRTRK